MSHPSVEALLRGDADALAHAVDCRACAAIPGLATPASSIASSSPEADLLDLPDIDRSLYTDFQPLDTGGMGRTWSARDRRLGRRVVIKELRDDLPDRRGLARRLEREARITAGLQHPSIVGVHEAGTWPGGEPFYAMPFIHGRPLEAALAESKTLTDRLALLPHVVAACEAVAYAHGQGVVHRDLKPANIMVGEYGETVVIDWGLATMRAPEEEAPISASSSDGLTQLGLGTASYMPPEQAAGESPTPLFDVYALGATLYHVLGGQPPYGVGDSPTIRKRLVAGPPAPLESLVEDIPPELVAIVDKAMAREGSARFATARELAAELHRFSTGQIILSHRYTLGELTRRFVRRHRKAVAFSTVALAALATVGIVSARRVTRERDRTRAALADSQASRGSLLASTPATRLEGVALALEASRSRPMSPRVFAGLVDAVSSGPMLVAMPQDEGFVRGAFAPGGELFATIEGDRHIRVWSVRTGKPRAELLVTLPHAYWLAWSPDGNALAISGLAPAVQVWNVSTGVSVELRERAPVELARFLDDGRLATAAQDGSLRLWRDGLVVAETATGCTPVVAAASSRLWLGCTDGRVVGWDGQTIATLDGMHGAVRGLAVDGSRVYAGDDAGRVLVWSSDTPAPPRELWNDPAKRIYALQLTKSWLQIATGTVTMLAPDGTSVDNYSIEIPASPPLFASAPRVPAVDRSTSTIAILDVAHREIVAQLAGHRAFGSAAAFGSPDGERVLSTTSTGEAYLWDARLGLTAGALPMHDGEVVAIAAAGSRVISLAVGGVEHVVDPITGALIESKPSAVISSTATRGARVLAGDAHGHLQLLDASSTHSWQAGEVAISAVALGESLAAAGDVDGAVSLWDPATGHPVFSAATGDPVTSIALDSAGQWLASAHHSGTVRIWTPEHAQWKARTEFAGDAAALVMAASDVGGPLAVARANRTDLIDPRTWTVVDGAPGRPVAWSSRGELAVVDDHTGRLLVWARSGVRLIADHVGTLTAAQFDTTGAFLWVGDAGGVLHRWSVTDATTTPLALAARGGGPLSALALTDDGQWVLAGHANGELRVIPATQSAATKRACTVLAQFDRAGPFTDLCEAR